MSTRRESGEMALPFRALVTGDTHLTGKRTRLPEQLLQVASEVERTIHTGDFSTCSALEQFETYGELFAVCGNNDEPTLGARLPKRLAISAGGLSLIVTHGHMERGRSARDAVHRTYAGQADLVIFGHSHEPCWEEVHGTWFLNPGSPTQRRRQPQHSFAILKIDAAQNIDVSFVYFDAQKQTG